MPDSVKENLIRSASPPRMKAADSSSKCAGGVTPSKSSGGGWGVCLPSSGSNSESKAVDLKLSPSLDVNEIELDLPASFVEMVKSQFVRYGDYIKLFTKSQYAKSKKHARDGFAFGSSTDGGYVGVYEKPDGTVRVAVPPIGKNCPGNFSESTFQILNPDNSEARIGDDVKYGDVVVLVDSRGMVWNNKLGGVFIEGYLGPKVRGIAGEVFISFRKNGKDGKELLYGDPGVFITVEESNRHRTTYNNRVTNYKTTSSKFAGGYIASDGTGKDLTFSIHPKSGLPEAAYDRNSSAKARLLRSMSTKSLRKGIPDIRCVKILRKNGSGGITSDIVVLDPAYERRFKAFNVGKEDKIVVVLYDNSEAVIEANNLVERVMRVSVGSTSDTESELDYVMASLGPGQHEDTFLKKYGARSNKKLENQHGLVSLQVFFEDEVGTEAPEEKDKLKNRVGADIWDVLFSFDKLAIVYVAVAFIFPYVLSILASFLDQNKQALYGFLKPVPMAESMFKLVSKKIISQYAFLDAISGLPSIPRRMGDVTDSKSIVWAVLTCWVCGLVTPSFVRTVDHQPPKDKGPKRKGHNLTISISTTHGCFKIQDDADTASTDKGSGDSESQVDEDKYLCEWRKAGMDENGIPHHPAFQRFLIGENNVMDVALKRWETSCSWREMRRVDDILEQPHPNFEVIKRAYPSILLGRSKKGFPVYIERPGEINMQMLRDANITLEDLLWHYVYTTEFVWRIVEPREGHPNAKFITILDLKGVRLFDLVGDAIAFLKNAVSISQDHYPERGAKIFIINAPFFFKRAFALVRPFMAEATLEKMEVHAKNYQQALLKDIDADVLPLRYGGNADVSGDDVPWEQLMRYSVGKQLLKSGGVLTGPKGEPDEASTEGLKRFVAEYEKNRKEEVLQKEYL